jgi:hypothetical protein
MSLRDGAARTLGALDAWFTAPEPNAAGRMGLFRVLFALFYLWHLSFFSVAAISGLPQLERQPIHLVDALWADPSPAAFHALEAVLVAALVLLLVGYRTRAATALVLAAGTLREAYPTWLSCENGNVFLTFYIPLFMALGGRWHDTYSLDAWLRRRAGHASVSPTDDSGSHFVAARAVLVVLAVLFCTSPLFKGLGAGTWLERPDLLANLMLEKSAAATVAGLPPNPIGPLLADHPRLGTALQLQVLAFEALFFLALFGRRLRSLFVALALLFHAANALWLVVTFTPILIVYGLFVDWQAALRRIAPPPRPAPEWASASLVVGVSVALALGAGASWHAWGGLRGALQLGGWLDWRTIWIPVLPLAAAWAGSSAVALATAARTRSRSPRVAQPRSSANARAAR